MKTKFSHSNNAQKQPTSRIVPLLPLLLSFCYFYRYFYRFNPSPLSHPLKCPERWGA
jgi:hypothetical protein